MAGSVRRSVSRSLAAVLLAVGVIVSSACASETTSTASAARLVDPGEFAAAVTEPERLTVNVHVPFEGDIPGTDLSIPFDQIAAQADRLPADRDTPLAIYCRSGPMSTVAAQALRDLGYTDVVELRGGMRAWQAEGRPIIGI
ncbi:rhodanese-like domain-containing protein [Mycolicibacterium elephantis]|uniref:Sulfurtransferase n=1 Tax=Mycolicibacterium elephantis TaxID=81858 RepID=A0A1A0QDE8_9MYCO|nr:rhodanese-like domain-containing protein [Mycolicibacterium elephantis]OBA85510.1 sulfurtransferase [Mycolicibacterium elephantis]OBB20147.1 sulfurtransferase [Mycolicibacterium elephantis]ORA61432.1 sulfurtransferase [Mycolicibacterium elephantis]